LILSGNIGNSTEIGAELSLRGHFSHDNWRWQLSYSPRFVQQQFAGVASPATTGSDFPRSTPRHIINASLGWSSGPWEADSFIRFESSSAGVFTPNLSSYSVVPVGASVSVDARIAYHFSKNFTASLSGQNILFSAARQTFFGKVEQRVLGGLTANF
jgi:outer membrane receptor protein involved in Fe transport